MGESAPSEPAACFVGGRISERVEKKRGSHGAGFRVAGPSCASGSVIHIGLIGVNSLAVKKLKAIGTSSD